MLSPNTILQKRYRIIRQLGQGGMGTVYEALDQRVSAIVALKETTVEMSEDSHHFFEREAALLANLRHQALPKVMDYFVDGNGEFLVMEYIAGNDLAESLKARGGPFELHRVLDWAGELLKVLEYLHGRTPPILHRDIKPSNLKVTKEGEIFLLDFGLAKGAAGQMPTLQTSRSVRGYTLVYSPLEQIVGQVTDQRSDIYSLGATLYNLLTGICPIDAPTRYSHVEDEEPDPLQLVDEVNKQVPSDIAAIIHQAMSISRKNRPASATEIRLKLQQAAERRRLEEAEQKRLAEESIRRAADERKQIENEEKRRLEDARRRRDEAERRRTTERDARLAAEINARRKSEKQRAQHEDEESRVYEGKTGNSIGANIDALCQEQGIDRDLVIEAIKEAVRAAAKKQFKGGEDIQVDWSPETGLELAALKAVVDAVTNPATELSIEEARELGGDDVEIGDALLLPLPMEELGPMAAQTAKQILFQKVRDAVRSNVYAQYIDHVGELVNGFVKRFERGNMIVDLGNLEAILPRSQQSRGEQWNQGERIRVVINNVSKETKGPQIEVSRTSLELLRRLFEREVPEISDGTVIIKSCVREPGERGKVAVMSTEPNVDPVGVCMGKKGSRVQAIIRELCGEKIDIIEWSDEILVFAANALSPAKVNRLSITDIKEQQIEVIVDDDQLSIVMGKHGQNLRLASELVGWNINVRS